MTDYTAHLNEISIDFVDVRAGKRKGWTCGFRTLDKQVSRLEVGHIWVVGGYSGTGKSAFILNMIKGILSEYRENDNEDYKPPKIGLFSTELTTKAYIKRFIFMESGVYPNQYQNSPMVFDAKVQTALDRFYEERILNPDSLNIWGEITSVEEIENILKKLEPDKRPNICFVDYVQELSAQGKYDTKDVMPLLAKWFKRMSFEYGVSFVLVSQVNNSSMVKSNDSSSSQLNPFSFGKEITQTAHATILLKREKAEGRLSNILKVEVLKAREGVMGYQEFSIMDGFNLAPIV